jgi:hypothetical protein
MWRRGIGFIVSCVFCCGWDVLRSEGVELMVGVIGNCIESINEARRGACESLEYNHHGVMVDV